MSVLIEQVDAAGKSVLAEFDLDGNAVAEGERKPIVVEAHMSVVGDAKSMQVVIAGKRNKADTAKWDVEPLFPRWGQDPCPGLLQRFAEEARLAASGLPFDCDPVAL